MQFVQIGSNDGSKHDPLHTTVMQTPGWSGVMVEPVPYVYRRLRDTYAGMARIQTVNLAIADTPGERSFYHLRQAGTNGTLPDWYDELGSFYKDVVLKHENEIPDIAQRLVETQVACTSFAALCESTAIKDLGLLHIDTEGYDYEIIKTVDFDRWKPWLIIYEHKHLSADDRLQCKSALQNAGYDCHESGADTWCVPNHLKAPGGDRFRQAAAKAFR